MNKYTTNGNPESEYEKNSNNEVLKNLLGIKSKQEIENAETVFLAETEEWAINSYSETHKFDCNDIKKMHKKWLGKIYPWAGKYRHVDLSKEGFVFAQVRFIDQLMIEFETDYLKKYTPTNTIKNINLLTDAMSKIHIELILIHPFREGNGRLGRLLINLMALQAGFNWLDFSLMNYSEYIAAIHQGIDRNYQVMAEIFKTLLLRSK